MARRGRWKQQARALEKVAKGGAMFAEGARMFNRIATEVGWEERFEESMLRKAEREASAAAHKAAVLREKLAKDEREGGGGHKKAGPSCLAATGPERDAGSVNGGRVAWGEAAGKAALLGEEEA